MLLDTLLTACPKNGAPIGIFFLLWLRKLSILSPYILQFYIFKFGTMRFPFWRPAFLCTAGESMGY